MPKYRFEPDFNELLRVLRRERPTRPVLFELFMCQPVYEYLAGYKLAGDTPDDHQQLMIDAFLAGGYDYVTTYGSDYCFKTREKQIKKTISLNEGYVITDRKSYEAYQWMDPDECDYSRLDDMGKRLPDGMKLMAMGPGGVLENVIALVGYDNLCIMLYEDPELMELIFEEVGKGLVRYYEIVAGFDSVGLLMDNDDWGFKTQTFLSPDDMRRFVFPWHKKIAEASHRHNKPVALHSCGYMTDIFDDIIDDIKIDGKHSYEDTILSVEDSYQRWSDRISILGGIDLNFIISSSVEDIQKRCKAMLELTDEQGSYALGSGNSIPEYVPYEKYRAMIDVALALR